MAVVAVAVDVATASSQTMVDTFKMGILYGKLRIIHRNKSLKMTVYGIPKKNDISTYYRI